MMLPSVSFGLPHVDGDQVVPQFERLDRHLVFFFGHARAVEVARFGGAHPDRRRAVGGEDV